MAIDAHSIPAPIDHRALLRSAVPVPTPALTAETLAMLDAIPPELPPEPLLDLARARHMRRALEGAVEHGAALLAALGLPQLVDDGFAPLDPVAAGDAIHHAIGTLDALDAPGMDLEDGGEAEPSLGWIDGKPVLSDSHDDREAEADDEPMLGAPERSPSSGPWGPERSPSGSQTDWADGSTRHDEAEAVNEDGGDILDEGEETLGWAANVGQLALGMTTADGDETALERHGKGFLRSGGDDMEPSLGALNCVMEAVVGLDGKVFRYGADQTHWSDGSRDDCELGDDNGIADMDGQHEQMLAHVGGYVG